MVGPVALSANREIPICPARNCVSGQNSTRWPDEQSKVLGKHGECCYLYTRMALLSVDQVADRLGVSRRTVYRMASEGTIAHHRIGGALRFQEADVDEYLERTRVPAKGDA